MLPYLMFAAAGYLSGSMLFSYFLPKWFKGIDVTREPADHNPGAANVYTQAGAAMAALCVLFDIAKGFVPVFVGMQVLDSYNLLFALVLAAPVVGHAFPWYAPRRGGKGIAVSFGVLLGLLPVYWVVLALAGAYLGLLLVSRLRPVSNLVLSIITFSAFALASPFLVQNPAVSAGCVIISAVVIFKHILARRRELAGAQEPGDKDQREQHVPA